MDKTERTSVTERLPMHGAELLLSLCAYIVRVVLRPTSVSFVFSPLLFDHVSPFFSLSPTPHSTPRELACPTPRKDEAVKETASCPHCFFLTFPLLSQHNEPKATGGVAYFSSKAFYPFYTQRLLGELKGERGTHNRKKKRESKHQSTSRQQPALPPKRRNDERDRKKVEQRSTVVVV